jgi:tetratricopeptide (TPR) repeat protein
MKLIVPFILICALLAASLVWQLLTGLDRAPAKQADPTWTRPPLAMPSQPAAAAAPQPAPPQPDASQPSPPSESSPRVTAEPSPTPQPPRPTEIRWAGEREADKRAARWQRIEAALAADPGHIAALRAAAALAQQEQRWAAAADYLTRLRVRQPDDPELSRTLAQTQIAQRRWLAARDTLTRHLEHWPADRAARTLAASVAEHAGHLRTAWSHWTQLVEKDPDNVTARAGRARIAAQLGETATARADLDWLAERDQLDTGGRLLRAELTAADGDWAAAEPIVQAVLDTAPNHVPALNQAAAIAWQRHRRSGERAAGERALAAWERSLSLDPDQPKIRRQFAFAREHFYPDQ